MKRKYYWDEHDRAYRRIAREGKAAWDDLHGGRGFDDFSSRAFLERVLPRLDLPPEPVGPRVLEYGCGTGPVACFLAARGFRVDAVDLVPAAIDLARRFAAARGLEIRFEVADVCALGPLPAGAAPPYDLVVDGYCLQSVVTDADRAALFAAVRSRLKPTGYYVVSTAMYQSERAYGAGEVYDTASGVVYAKPWDPPDRYDGAVRIGGVWYVPYRRHLKPEALRGELERAGFRLLSQEGATGGEVVCVRSDGTAGTRVHAG